MSSTLKLESIPEETKEKIENDLKFQINKPPKNRPLIHRQPPQYIHPYDLDDNDQVYLPFSYGYNQLNIPKREKSEYTKISHKTELSVRPEQKKLINETIKCLNKSNTCIVSAYTGFGKCLAPDTKVLMYDGNVKLVQDIAKGDKIMGDDSHQRNVISTSKGREMMYKIKLVNGENFSVNESHIISLSVDFSLYGVFWDSSSECYYTYYLERETLKIRRCFSKKSSVIKEYIKFSKEHDNIINITIPEYLNLNDDTKKFLKCYKKTAYFKSHPTKINPYILGLILGKYGDDKKIMKHIFKIKSLKSMFTSDMIKEYRNLERIPGNYLINSLKVRYQLLSGFIYASSISDSIYTTVFIHGRKLAKDVLFLCNSLCLRVDTIKMKSGKYSITISGCNLLNIRSNRRLRPVFNDSNIMFCHDSIIRYDFEVEKLGIGDYYGFEIDGNRLFMLANFIVTHNTFCSLVLSSRIGLKTMIIVNKLVLMGQWEKSINKIFPNASVLKIKPSSKTIEKGHDFYIVNAINVEKFPREEFLDFGLVIVDEAHLIMAKTLSKSLLHICPRYLIGLTATPYRPDGLNDLLDIYFSENRIVRKLWREHLVYKVNTGFKPEISYNAQGQLNWGRILDDVSNNEERNDLIVDIVTRYKERNFLILTKRITQGEILYEKLLEKGENVETLLGKKQEFDKECRILIGTCQKVGVGFDFPKIDTLMIATDIEEYFIQYLGRCMRREDVNPVVFDLVDDNKVLKRHYKTREKIYKEHGGMIEEYKL